MHISFRVKPTIGRSLENGNPLTDLAEKKKNYIRYKTLARTVCNEFQDTKCLRCRKVDQLFKNVSSEIIFYRLHSLVWFIVHPWCLRPMPMYVHVYQQLVTQKLSGISYTVCLKHLVTYICVNTYIFYDDPPSLFWYPLL